MRNLLCGNYGQLCQKAPKAHPLSTSSSPRMHSQRTLSSHSVFLIPWDTPANNPSRAKDMEKLLSSTRLPLLMYFQRSCHIYLKNR
ncbi:hypothetical protein ACFX2H_032176 [Malus domestica]